MDMDFVDDHALLLPVSASDRALYKDLNEEEEEKEEEAWLQPSHNTRRRRVRLYRMDVACLAVVGLVACIITVRQPALRTENPLLYPVAKKAPTPALPDFVTYADVDVGQRHAYKSQYKTRGLEVDGHATLLLGTDFPYARTAPEEWQALLDEAKRDGNNAVTVDVTWKQHETKRGVFNLSDGANLTRVYELAKEAGVFVHARFHPRDCAQTPGTDTDIKSTSAHGWKEDVERFVTVMVAVSRPFLSSNGGPIVTTELAASDCAGARGSRQWTEDLLGLMNTSTPWTTSDPGAAGYALHACDDALDCEKFAVEQSTHEDSSPLLWARPHSCASVSAPQLAYHVARWFAVGGTAYSDHMIGETLDAADGNVTETSRQLSRLHLSKLRYALRSCSRTLTANSPVVEDVDFSSLRPKWQRALVFGTATEDQVVFLENAGDEVARVAFHGTLYDLAAKSVVLVRNGAVLFNTSDIHNTAQVAGGYRDATTPDALTTAFGR